MPKIIENLQEKLTMEARLQLLDAGYSAMTIRSVAAPIRPFCSDDYTADFIAEALLTWSLAGTPFCQLYGIIRKIV